MKRMTDEQFEAHLATYNYGSAAKAFAADEARRARAREARLEAALRNLVTVAVSHGVSELHGVITNAVTALTEAE